MLGEEVSGHVFLVDLFVIIALHTSVQMVKTPALGRYTLLPADLHYMPPILKAYIIYSGLFIHIFIT